MGVDIVCVSDKTRQYTIEEAEYALLYPAIVALKKRTGIYIDQYSDTKHVHFEHLRIIAEHAAASEHGGKLHDLLIFLNQAIAARDSLNFYGD